MTIITKNIGRLPVNLGDYDSTRAYGRKNRCLQYGCEVESLVENNTDAPFTWDGSETFTLNPNWRLISGNPEVWAAGNPKPAASEDYPYNGMGRVVIPKNMQNIAEEGEPENIVNLLTQAVFEDGEGNPLSNTVFVIQYDFTLGEDITIPANCVLEFDGGSISGEYTITGQNTGIKAGLVKIFNTDVILAGTWNINKFDIRWFGVADNDSTVDCTPIINNIKDIYVPIYFPKGTYYLSELYYQNTKQERFIIEGEKDEGLTPIVNFMPYNDSQRYIIKIGGGANTLGGDGRGYNIKITDINFKTPRGYTPGQLTNSYSSDVSDYLNGGIILDVIEIGKFSLGGSEIHNMPFLTFGYIYECEFDYLICYGNHGKSIQPAIQIVNTTHKPYSALHVKKMMGEVIVGPMIKTVGRCAGSELVIDNFYFEGTVEWEMESISSETRYSDVINLSDFEIVPIFYLNSCGFDIVNAEMNVVNTKWSNSLDDYSKQCVRGLLHFNNTLSTGIQIINLNNNGGSKWMYITGSSNDGYPASVVVVNANCYFQQNVKNTSLVVEDKRIIDNNNPRSIKSNFVYSGNELNDITIPYFIDNVGTTNYINQRNENEKKSVFTRYNSYMFTELGFDLDINMSCFFIESFVNTISMCNITIEYYNEDKIFISSENVGIKADMNINAEVVTINPPVNARMIKLKWETNSGYGINVYKFGFFDPINVPIIKSGSTRPIERLLTPGFQFYDKTLSKPIWYKGSNVWVDATGTPV